MHGDAIGTQHALDLREHRILVRKIDVTKNVQAHNVIKRRIRKGQFSQLAHASDVVTVATRLVDEVGREIQAGKMDVFAFE